MESRFDLATAVATWRQFQARRYRFLEEDLDELEVHLRAHMAELQRQGWSGEAAFREAVRSLGDLEEAEVEYRKVHWSKLRRRHKLTDELRWRGSMFKNYINVALRMLGKQKGYATINIVGLATGLTCFLLILLFVQHELSYDRFHEKADQIYRVIQLRHTPSGSDLWADTSPAMAPALMRVFPEVEVVTTVGATRDPLLSIGEKHFKKHGILADPHFFDVFSFPLLQGNANTALAGVNSIVLTQTLAETIFGDQDPMGQTLLYRNTQAHIVTGIMADVPTTSHLQFDYVLPVRSHQWYGAALDLPPWVKFDNGWYTFALLTEGADAGQLEEKVSSYIAEHRGNRPENRYEYLLQPLTDIHLGSQHISLEPRADPKQVYLFLAIGFVILLLACVNYTNLAVSRSIKRAREVGLRKVVGALRGQLLSQFLGESVLMTLLALGLALGLVHVLLPTFAHLVDRPIVMDYMGNRWLLPGLLALVVVVGLLAGSYPAVFMAKLRPIHVLTGGGVGGTSRFRIQRLLLVGQFVASTVLVAGSFVVYEQLQYLQQQELGYDREHILTVQVSDPALRQKYASIRDALLRDSRVIELSYSWHLPTDIGYKLFIAQWEGSDGANLTTNTTRVDYDFFDVFGIEMAAGRAFSREFATDTLNADIVMINETAARAMGWTPEEAVGQQLNLADLKAGTMRPIIGVMKDFHFSSIHNRVEPLVLTLNRGSTGYISAKIQSGDVSGTLALIERTIKQFTSYPFEYQFLDEHFDALYKQDVRLGETVGFFTILALLIASLGLFGLAAYAAEQRTKEVGIRKVLGASVGSIMTLLSKEFLKLVGLGCLVAVPLAYLVMERWLDGFVYRIQLGPSVFILAGGLVLSIAVVSVCYQAIVTARANPVKSMRYE